MSFSVQVMVKKEFDSNAETEKRMNEKNKQKDDSFLHAKSNESFQCESNGGEEEEREDEDGEN